MADEILGNCYELITEIAIRDYSSVLKKGESVFTQETPVGIGIIPDVVIGKTVHKPRILLQVHHTRAESASQKKFWRNIGEYVDARNNLGPSVRIVTITFDSGQKRKLTLAATQLMDGFLEVDRQHYGSELLRFATKLEKEIQSKGIKEEERLNFAQKKLASDKLATRAVKALAKNLNALLLNSSKPGANWSATYAAIQKMRKSQRIPVRKLTTLRRALGRLLPIDDEGLLRTLLKSVRSGARAHWPQFLFDIGVASKAIGGGVFRNPHVGTGVVPRNIEGNPAYEVYRMTELFTDDDIVALWKSLRSCTASLKQACAAIREADEFSLYHKFVVDNFDCLSTQVGMEQALQDCFKDPDTVLGKSIGLRDPAGKGVWLFDYVMTAIKARTGKQQGYGYTQLGADAGFRFEVAATGGVVISPFIQRKKSLRADILKGVSHALSQKLANLTKRWFNLNKDEIGRFYLKGLFEDKIYKTADFDPAFTLLQKELCGHVFEHETRQATFLTGFTSKGAATCDVIKYRRSIIMSQSASAQGDDHKTKELCGRIGMLRVSNGKKGKVVPASFKKALLVIDGTWKDDQLQQLAKAGFDGIFYVDEVPALVASLR
jgi:hypothetical protein